MTRRSNEAMPFFLTQIDWERFKDSVRLDMDKIDEDVKRLNSLQHDLIEKYGFKSMIEALQ
jgi:tetrahydromethanopterin S-methyltransferase subunit B